MARFKKLNTQIDRMMARMNEIGDEALQAMRNAPEAKARQEAMLVKIVAAEKRRAAKQAKSRAAAVAANMFKVGDNVRHTRGMIANATVSGVSGSTITLDNGRTFAADVFVLA